MNRLRLYLKLLRPHQWIKSGFVFVGLLFGHAWNDPVLVGAVLRAAAAFAGAASAIYVLNDYIDRERDRAHPEKCRRPLACGAISGGEAALLGVVCLGVALALAASVSSLVFGVIAAYLLLNVAYSLGLKHVVLLDVFIISAGFMLRILAGTLGVGIEPSHWLLLCGLLVTLFLGFAKRRAELAALEGGGGSHRQVLDDYDPQLLDKLIGICAAGTLVTYSLYTVSPETVAMHGTGNLVYSVPCVLYGLFRYLYLIHVKKEGGAPDELVFQDRPLLITNVL